MPSKRRIPYSNEEIDFFLMQSEDRFRTFMSEPDERGCINWKGGKSSGGYGVFSVKRRSLIASRCAYRIFVGKIPRGLFVCHTCDNPACVNPEHLFLGSDQDNKDDMVNKNRVASLENNGRAKINQGIAQEIRARVEQGESQMKLAREFKIGRTTVGHIVAGRTWQNDR